ncbi:DUF6907 domain-containing protein [Streptomyces sp. NPDC020489]|uniref:DUF6907 domain-containing protein n=1 Tax=Streptomyces sp. NPDC020489 TaxID=3365077 RepID=UPI00379628F6
MTEPRTVTLSTLDHGDVTIPEPDWCAGHADYVPVHRVDLEHAGVQHRLTHDGQLLGYAYLFQDVFAERSPRDIGVSVVLSYEPRGGFTPAGLYDFAASLDTAADRLRYLADQLATILGGER